MGDGQAHTLPAVILKGWVKAETVAYSPQWFDQGTFKKSWCPPPALRLGDWDSINLKDCQDVCAFSSSRGDSDTKRSLRINEVAQRLRARGLGSGALRLKINAAIHYLCGFRQATVP